MANDASTPTTGAESAPEEHKTGASIRLIIADTEPIFRVGIRKVVALEVDIRPGRRMLPAHGRDDRSAGILA